MEQKLNNNETKQTLRQRIFTEPTTHETRPHLVRYVQVLAVEAERLTKDELYSDEGHDIAMDICGALAFQGADGVEGDKWLNESDEPALSHILAISSTLDADANNPDAWNELFASVKSLQ